MQEIAYAKINLALHVRKRRADGYHEIETVFAFVDAGDRLSVTPAGEDRLMVCGEFGSQLNDPFGNIVAKALSSLPRKEGWAVTLEKNLPVAAGLGGGSADAGAIFRLVEREVGLPDGWEAKAAALGADVPACVTSECAIGRGIGTELETVNNDLAGVSVLLVNPRIPLDTSAVYRGWDGEDRGALPDGDIRTMTLDGRNDLEAPAIAICPEISGVLVALWATSPLVARMSGSGATCFALYESEEQAEKTMQGLSGAHPEWWFLKGRLR